MAIPDDAGDPVVVSLLREDATVTKRTVAHGRVRVRTITHAHDEPISTTLRRERFEIDRIPIGRIVDVAPPVREDGDVTIVPVMEEVLVVERRLMLKEEVRIRRITTFERHDDLVSLRNQEVVVEHLSVTGEPPSEGGVALSSKS